MPAATPKSDAVRLRILEMTCGESKSVTTSCRAEAQQDRLCRMPGGGNDKVPWRLISVPGYCAVRCLQRLG